MVFRGGGGGLAGKKRMVWESNWQGDAEMKFRVTVKGGPTARAGTGGSQLSYR